MLTPEENLAYEYLVDQALNGPTPEGVENYQRPTREELDAAPEAHKRYMIGLILGFQKENPLMKKILTDYHKKFDDAAFGMRVKSYIKELL